VAAIYLRGWVQLRVAIPTLVPASRVAAFIAGLLAIWIAVGSPLGILDHSALTAHMVQHLLLMTIAPPLLLLGAPVVALLHGLPPMIVRASSPTLAWWWIRWLGRVLGHPAFCLLAASSALIGWHIPAVFELALRSDSWHVVERASFFITGMLLWWPVIQPWPIVGKWPEWLVLGYLFLATLPCDALSAFLTFYDGVVYSRYRSAPAFWGRSPLQDQQFAGALMWICVTFIYMVPAVLITVHMLSPRSHTGPAIQVGKATPNREASSTPSLTSSFRL
jgi:cytochrome c oxidase assembly factor CtaG